MLELCQRTKDVKDQFIAASRRVDALLETAKPYFALLQVRHHIDQMLQRPPQTFSRWLPNAGRL
jgi:hypothetical protein